MATDELKYVLKGDDKPLQDALKRATEAIKKSAEEMTRAAAAAGKQSEALAAPLISWQQSFKNASSGVSQELNKLGNALGKFAGLSEGSLGGMAQGAKVAIDAFSGFASGGPVGLGLVLLRTGIGFVTDKLTEQKREAEAAAKALKKRSEEATNELNREILALDKILDREKNLKEARAGGITEDAAARKRSLERLNAGLPEKTAAADDAGARRAALGKQIEEEERALAEMRATAMKRYQGMIPAALEQEMRARKVAIGELRELHGKAISEETQRFEAKEKDLTAIATVSGEGRIQAELDLARRSEEIQRDRATAAAKILSLDVSDRAGQIQRDEEVTSAVARAQAELEFADALIATNDARAKGVELQVLQRNLANAIADDERTRLVERDRLGKEAQAGLQRDLDMLGLKTAGEKALYEVERGRYAHLTAEQKANITRIAGEIEATNAKLDAEKARLEVIAKAESDLQRLREQAMTAEQKRAADIGAWTIALQSGIVTETQHAEALRLVNAEYDKMNAKALASSASTKAAAEEVADQWNQIKNLGENTALSLSDALVDGFFEPQKNDWAAWLADVSKQIMKAIAKLMLMKAIESGLSAIGGGAPVAGAAAVVKAAGGGVIRGPGTSTSDSIPAWLSTGEVVINAAASRRYGYDRLLAINAQKFASGGVVGAPLPARADAGGSSPVSFRIMNSLDPSVMTSAMGSSEGERIILNVISANSDAARSALGL